ncbi:small conductance mechanosensitive ion channel family protein transporter, partial [Escherichia coli H120]
MIDQLRTVAATPPAEPVPKIVPPTLVEEQTVLQKVTEVSRHYGEAPFRPFRTTLSQYQPAPRI